MKKQKDNAQVTLPTGSDPIPTQPAKPTDPMASGPLPKAAPKVDIPDSLRIRYKLPNTAKHLAKIYVHKANADMELALATIKPEHEPADYATYARFLLRQPEIIEAIDAEYRAMGINDDAREMFFGDLWKTAREGSEKERIAARALLARAFGIGDIADESRKVQPLPIKGIEAGWKKMTEGADAEAAQNPTGFATIKEAPDADE